MFSELHALFNNFKTSKVNIGVYLIGDSEVLRVTVIEVFDSYVTLQEKNNSRVIHVPYTAIKKIIKE